MTLEASLVIPIFLIFMMTVACFLEVVCMQGDVTAALHQTGNQMVFLAYEESTATSGEALFKAYMTRYGNHQKWILENQGDIQISQSAAAGRSGDLDLTVTYQPAYFGHWLFTLPVIQMERSYYGHYWIGYVGGTFTDSDFAEDPYVYVTETGTVYHRDRDCSYLNPSIQAVSRDELLTDRNESGGKYHECELCGKGAGNYVYITSYGTRYHSSRTCSGLKRTIYSIRLSEVGDRAPCSKCG